MPIPETAVDLLCLAREVANDATGARDDKEATDRLGDMQNFKLVGVASSSSELALDLVPMSPPPKNLFVTIFRKPPPTVSVLESAPSAPD